MARRIGGHWLALWLTVGLAALWPLGPAPADTANPVMMSRKEGDVEARRGGTNLWTPVISNKLLAVGDLGRTGGDGKAILELREEKIKLGVGPKTLFSVLEVVQGFGGKVQLNYGALWPHLERKDVPDRFQVVTPNAVLSAQGTEWIVHHVAVDEATGQTMGKEAQPANWDGNTEPNHTRAVIRDGTVKVTGINGEVQMASKGDTLDVGPEGTIQMNPPAFPYPHDPTETRSVSKGPRGIEKGTLGAGEGGGFAGGSSGGTSTGPIQTNISTVNSSSSGPPCPYP